MSPPGRNPPVRSMRRLPFSRATDAAFRARHGGDIIFNGVASDVQRDSLLNGFQGDAAYHLGPHTIRFGFEVSGETTIDQQLIWCCSTTGNPETPFAVNDSSIQARLAWLGSMRRTNGASPIS